MHLVWCPTLRVLLSEEQKALTATPHGSSPLLSQEENLILSIRSFWSSPKASQHTSLLKNGKLMFSNTKHVSKGKYCPLLTCYGKPPGGIAADPRANEKKSSLKLTVWNSQMLICFIVSMFACNKVFPSPQSVVLHCQKSTLWILLNSEYSERVWRKGVSHFSTLLL